MLWQDALKKEMGNVCIAFEILGPKAKAPVGWHKASGHIVFDVKWTLLGRPVGSRMVTRLLIR
jgi:hypothetical protein